MRIDFLGLLQCGSCGSPLTVQTVAPCRPDTLTCVGCLRSFPIVNGIPRFVDVAEDDTARRTQASFGYEWTHFNDWRQSGEANFQDYFVGLDLTTLRGASVLDAGCGMGRHARQIAKHAGQVVAVDFSRAIDQAARNVADIGNVDCIQADLLALPLVDRGFDYVYSLGVLHHLADTDRALANLVRTTKPGGRVRIYLYWKRHGWKGGLLRLVTAARSLTTRMPFFLLRWSCFLLSLLLYASVVIPYRMLSRLGTEAISSWPLFVYTKYPFAVLYNDQ